MKFLCGIEEAADQAAAACRAWYQHFKCGACSRYQFVV